MSMLDHALDYAARGLPVFPCSPSEPGVKRPLVPRDTDFQGVPIPKTGGVAKATTDSNQIREWWARWPSALIGGAMGGSLRLLAVDPDAQKKRGDPDGLAAWIALVERHGGVSATHAHMTPSGGRHYIFELPEGIELGNREGALKGTGINVRGTGGYLIMAPSRLADGRNYRVADDADFWRFAPAPKWLLDLIMDAPELPSKSGRRAEAEPRKAAPLSDPADRASRAGTSWDRYVAAAVDRECGAVAGCAAGGRNNRLNDAAFALGQLVGSDVLDRSGAEQRLYDAAVACGHVEDKGRAATLATIASGIHAGVTKPRDMSKVRERVRRSESVAQPTRQEQDSADPADPAGPGDTVGLVTEDEGAMRFAEQHGGALRYCHGHGAWFEWTGAKWKRDGTARAFHYARELARVMASGQDRATQTRARKAAFARAVEGFARADPIFSVEADAWDYNPWLLGTPGGTVDLRTGVLLRAKPGDGITRTTAVTPRDTVDCALWLRFLEEATNGDAEMIRFLQLWAGYCLTGDTREHALVFLFGPGGNGKSVAVNVQAGIMGDYAVTASMDTFIASKSDRHPTDLAMLRGARLVTASETEEGRQWAESRIKQLTGGDKIAARFMRQDFFTFLPSFKLQIIGNHKPGLRNVDEAARRRFNLVPFVHMPAKPDSQLEQNLKAEWPGILRWAIEGCLAWQRDGLVRPASVKEATAAYFADQDTFRTWLEEECEVDPGNPSKIGTSSELYAAWGQFAKAAGEDAMTRKAFSERMQRAGFEVHRGAKGIRVYRGVHLHMVRRPETFAEECRAH